MTAAYDHDALPEPCHEPGHAHGCPCFAGGDAVTEHDLHVRDGMADGNCCDCERVWEYWNMRGRDVAGLRVW